MGIRRIAGPFCDSWGRAGLVQHPVEPVDFLRLMPQKIPDYWAAFGVCGVKNRPIGDF
jgi:hypothetical protein